MTATAYDTDLLPASARELAEVIGLAATLTLIEHHGGTRLYVPKRLTPDNDLIETIGASAAGDLVDTYAGDTIDVPRGLRAVRAALYRRIVADYTDGATAAELALRHAKTERWIYAIVARHRAEAAARQQDLF